MVTETVQVAETPATSVDRRQAARQDEEAWQVTRRHGPTSYYGLPVLKDPRWGWQIPVYFFAGGLASGSYLIATMADLFGSREDRAVSRAGRYIALLALVASPVLLILDLGRPSRFTHMLRVLKVRSPMNLGTWGLLGFGIFAGMGILRQWVEDGLVSRSSALARALGWMPLQVSGVLGSLLAFFVGSYTGVLISFTNAPIWAKNRLLQGPLFLASALSSGISAVTLWLTLAGQSNPHTERWMKQLEDTVVMGEAAATVGTIATLGPLARPMVAGRYAAALWLGAVGMGNVLPLVLRRIEDSVHVGARRALRIARGISSLTGSLIFRWVDARLAGPAIEDPGFYFAFTRGRD